MSRHAARPAPRHARRRSRLPGVLLGIVAVVLGTTTAWAFWTGTIAPGGHGAAAATRLLAGPRPTATATGSTVTVSWEAGATVSGVPVTGYTVSRYDAATGTRRTAGAGCGAAVTTSTCTELNVPDGTWVYTVTPRLGTKWHGSESPRSGAVVVDTTGPSGGSVDGVGLKGSGGRYSTATALTLRLAPGTDPNGLATSGARLLRASATLASTGGANGGCSPYGDYTAVTTDPAASYTDTVPQAGRCYRYRYVVQDTFGNTTTYTSPDIKVDTTAPPAPRVLHGKVTNASWRSPNLFFNPTATSISAVVTATSADAESGVASYWFPPGGSDWQITASGDTATYSWTGTPPATGGHRWVTATNHAGATSAQADVWLVADGTPPTPGSVSYPDGVTMATDVPVSFTAGTDSQSGVASRVLERASASHSGGSCGPFGSFTAVAKEPTSPYTDRVTAGSCYRYRYVVTDDVGNAHIATSPAMVTVVVESPYVTAVKSTAGLTSYWRLGEALVASDSFTGTAGASLLSRTGERGASWAKVPLAGATSADPVLTSTGRIRRSAAADATTGTVAYASGVPATADYTVSADVHAASLLAGDSAGVMGRVQPGAAAGYAAVYDQTVQAWQIVKAAGSRSVIAASAAEPLTPGRSYRLALEMRGSQLRLLVDGVEKAMVNDGSVTTPGRGALMFGFGSAGSVAPSDTTGLQLDDFRVTPPMRDAVGSAHGTYLGAVQLGEAGATVDLDGALRLDWADDAAAASRRIAADTTLELLFRSRAWNTPQRVANWWEGRPLLTVDLPGTSGDFGLSVGTDGKVLAGAGTGGTLTTPQATNDSTWHHLALTRAQNGTVTLYLDGQPVGRLTGPVVSDLATIGVARARDAGFGDAFIDEVAVYDTVLSSTTISAHAAKRYAAGVRWPSPG